MDNESETLPLHNRISALLKDKNDLWAMLSSLQAALERAKTGLDASRMDAVFTPTVKGIMGARQTDTTPALASLRFSRKCLDRDGNLIGAVLENTALGGEGIHVGITDRKDPRVLAVEIL